MTTTPNQLCAELYNRMPVILGPAAWPIRLDEDPADESRLNLLNGPLFARISAEVGRECASQLSEQVMSGWSRERAFPSLASMSPASTRTPTRSPACNGARCQSSSLGSAR